MKTEPDFMTWPEIAASAYRAYAANTGNKNFRGEPMPSWEDLTPAIRNAWQAAVRQTESCLRTGKSGDEFKWNGWTGPTE